MSDPALMAAPDPVLEGFRHAMRRVASGVSLVATGDSTGNRFGIAMTAFMSLSFDPPSMIIAVNRTASIHGPLLSIGRFCVNVLAADQEDLCRDFVSRASHDRFSAGEWSANDDAIPYLPGAQTNIFCTVDSHQSSGSHDIIVGRVTLVTNRADISPLVFVDGRYGNIAW